MKSLVVVFFLIFWPLVFQGQETKEDASSSWSDVIKDQKGKVTFHWQSSRPFIYIEDQQIIGIEYELALSFISFLESEYKIDLEVSWVKEASFEDVIYKLNNFRSGSFGMSSISYTDERAEVVKFAPPYIPDIAVLISSPNIPIALTKNEFKETLGGLTAVTIENSTFERKLNEIKNDSVDFDIVYLDNAGQIISTIENSENLFGYTDLPGFLLALKQGTSAQRQFFFPLDLQGLAMIYPLSSDWDEPVGAYFNSKQFDLDKTRIISKYMGEDVMELMNTISKSAEIGPFEEIVILTKEKEVQSKELLDSAIKAHRDELIRNLLIGGVIFVVLIALLWYSRYNLKAKANLELATKQEQIEERNRQLTELNTEKNNLINVLAHDLRAPIAQIKGLAEVYLLENTEMLNEQKEIIEHIVQSSDRLSDLIKKILDVDAIETHRLNLKLERLNLREVLESVVFDFSELSKAKSIELKTVTLKNDLFAKGDKIYLTQVLENLVSNAMKFSNRDTTITLDIQESNEHLTVSVADHGPGFTDEDKEHIFKKFHRLSAKPTAGEHSIGLGLSIVKMYTELMNGSISCKSEVGKGTTFFVTLDKVA